VSDQDPHSPTTAGPEPAATPPASEPTPVVGASEATWGQPAGSALLEGGPAGAPVDPHPEKAVGAAFAGGLVAALFLKSLANRRHR
jgi:hypothetical protein